MKLLAVDSNSIINRAFYGIKLLSTKDGMYTNGIFGFLNILNKMLQETQPDAVACAFDLRAPTFRHKKYDGYKAQRKGMPDELVMQVPVLKEILTALGYKIVEIEGFEADDILGTLSDACCRAGNQCVIATGDRDSLQLVNGCVSVRLASTYMGKNQVTVYDEQAVFEKYGVTPAQLIEVKALMGDSSDNIPGVAGIGEKTALSLIAQYKSIDYIYENLDEIDVKAGVRAKLAENKDMAYLSRELAAICKTVPINTDINAYIPSPQDSAKVHSLFAKLEMFSLMEKFSVNSNIANSGGEAKAQAAGGCKIRVNALTQDELNEYLAKAHADFIPEIKDDELKAIALCSENKLDIIDSGHCCFKQLAGLLLSSTVPKRTVYIKELYRAAIKNGFEINNVVFDVQLAAYLINPSATDYSLARLFDEYNCPLPPINGECRESLKPLAENMARFNRLCERLSLKIEQYNQQKLLAEIELPLAEVLASMEITGFSLDVDGIKRYGEMLDGDIARLQEKIYELAGGEININSPKQLGELLFVKLGLPAKKKTKSGFSTNAEVLEELKTVHPIVEYILEYRKLAKLKSTYVEGLLRLVDSEGRIHTSFKQTETRTGRISSTEPNLQNIPIRTELGSKLRAYFRAKPGCKLLDADYSQIELRVLAHLANDSNMIAAFQSGEDIHTNTAAQVFNMPPLYITPLMRSRAKAVNFGIVYGIGAFSLSQDIGVSVAEADKYIKNYLKTYSGVKKYMEETISFCRENGYVETMFKRRRYLPEINAANKIVKAQGERIAMNTPIQGTAADIIKIAMIRVFNRLKKENLKARLILQVHDELIVESPEDEVEKARLIVAEEMRNAVKMSVALDAEVNIGDNWLEAK